MTALHRVVGAVLFACLLLSGALAPAAWAAGSDGAPMSPAPTPQLALRQPSPAQSSVAQPSATTAPALVTAWTSPMDLLLQPFPKVAADNTTVRDLATVAVAGTSVSLRLSNAWGPAPVTFGAVTVAERAGTTGAGAVPGTLVPVTFGGSPSVTIAAGQDVTSDPAAITVRAGETLVVSLWVPGVAPVSVHDCCLGKTAAFYTRNGGGDQTTALSGSVFTGSDWWTRWLSAVEVGGSQARGTVVAFGDSITDGFGYQTAGYSWVGALDQRISQLPASDQVAVVNEGISGNTLTAFPPGRNAGGEENSYATSGGGTPGLERLGRDALDLPGVKAVVVLLGTNDIWFGYTDGDPPYGSAASIIAGMKQLISQVHAAGLPVYGIPLLPRKTSPACTQPGSCRPEEWGPAEQATLETVDSWALGPHSGFDGTINLAAVVGDVYSGHCQPWSPYPPYFNKDNLHPNVAGQTAMANAVPTTLFGIPQAPQLEPVVDAVPTPHCRGATTAEKVVAAARSAASGPSLGGATTTTASPTGSRSTSPSSRPGSRRSSPTSTSSSTSTSTPTSTPTGARTSASGPSSTSGISTGASASTSSSALAAGGTAGAEGARPSGGGGGLGSGKTVLLIVLAVAALVLAGVSWSMRNGAGARRR